MPRNPNNGAEDWVKFKDVICDLYSSHQLEGPGGVIEFMKEHHKFVRSKGQYVSKLRDWKISKYSKNTSSSDWKAASYKVNKAKRKGKQVQLYHQKSLVTPKVLQTRGYLTAIEEKGFQASSPQTPADFTLSVQSPRPFIELDMPYDSLWNIARDLISSFGGFTAAHDMSIGSSFQLHSGDNKLLLELLPPSCSWPTTPGAKNKIQKVSTEHQFKFIAYVLSNNHNTRLNQMYSVTELLEILKQFDTFALLNSASPLQRPSLQALNEGIFRLAITAEDLETVEYMLKNAMDPNNYILDHPDVVFCRNVTPLQFSLLAGNLELSKLLIDYGAKLDHPYNEWKSSAIVLAIFGWRDKLEPPIVNGSEDEDILLKQAVLTITRFVQYLISCGAIVNGKDLVSHQGIQEFSRDMFLDDNAIPQPSHTPLTIASRYQLVVLVDIFLSLESFNPGPSKIELTCAFASTLFQCTHWCHLVTMAFDSPSYFMPTFPLEITSKLLEAGVDINDGLFNQQLLPFSHCLELLTFSASWRANAADVLFQYGPKPNVSILKYLKQTEDESFSTRICTLVAQNLSQVGMIEFIRSLKKPIPGMKTGNPSEDTCIAVLRSLDGILYVGLLYTFLMTILEECGPNSLQAFVPSCKSSSLLVSKFIYELELCFDNGKDHRGVLSVLSTISLDLLLEVNDGKFQKLVQYMSKVSTSFIQMSVEQFNAPLTEYLIKQGLDVNDVAIRRYTDPCGGKWFPETALCTSIRLGDKITMHLLVEHGAKYDVAVGRCVACPRAIYCSALSSAVQLGDIELIVSLITLGADINVRVPSAFLLKSGQMDVTERRDVRTVDTQCCATPLTLYLQNGSDLELIATLLDLGANPNQIQGDDELGHHPSPLEVLANNFDEDSQPKEAVLIEMLNRGANPLDTGALRTFGIFKNTRPLNIMLQMIAFHYLPTSVTISAVTMALMQAINLRNKGLVKGILDRNFIRIQEAEPSIRFSICGAISSNDIELVKLLLDYGIQPAPHAHFIKRPSALRPYCCTSALERASHEGLYEMVNLLISNKTEMSALEYPSQIAIALVAAVDAKHFDIATLLVENGANVNLTTSPEHPATCLQIVASYGNLKWAKYLIRHGADPNAASYPMGGISGDTALQRAVSIGSLDMVRFLVENGANVNVKPTRMTGHTALQTAAKHGLYPIAEFLIRHGAHVNAKHSENDWQTALGCAADSGRFDIVRLLLDHGAGDGDEDFESRKAACALAEARGHLAIRDVILQACEI